MMGDEMAIAAGRPAMLRAQVIGGRGLVLKIVSGRGVKRVSVAGNNFTHRWQARPKGGTFYRLELVEPSGGEIARDSAAALPLSPTACL